MKRENSRLAGYLAAFLTIFIWGTTFTSSKILLQILTPFELLFMRFAIGYIGLILLSLGRGIPFLGKREAQFALAGITGVTVHYLAENIAVQYSMASMVGIIKSISPFFIALISSLVLREKKLGICFTAGFIIVMAGIIMVNTGDAAESGTVSAGNIWAVFSAFMWAVYSVIIKKMERIPYGIIAVTRRIFFYGILFMIPFFPVFGFQADIREIVKGTALLHLLFLGIGASAVTFLSWNTAVKILGPVKTGVYIYFTPVITAVVSAIWLKEPVTAWTLCGIVLILTGLSVSEGMFRGKKRSGRLK